MDPDASHHDHKVLYKEVEVLEDKEKAEVEGHARNQDASFLQRIMNEQHTQPVVNCGRSCDEDQKAPIPVTIEDVAGDQEQAVLDFWPSSENPVNGIHKTEEREEREAVEYQRARFLVLLGECCQW